MQDLEDALLVDPQCTEVLQQCKLAKAVLAEHQQLRQLDGTRSAAPADHTLLMQCRLLDQLVLAVKSHRLQQSAETGKENASVKAESSFQTGSSADVTQPQRLTTDVCQSASQACDVLAKSEQLQLYCRACGALSAVSDALHTQLQQPGNDQGVAVLASFLSKACQLDSNILALCGHENKVGNIQHALARAAASPVSPPPVKLVTLFKAAGQHEEVAVLLHALSTQAAGRKAVASAAQRTLQGTQLGPELIVKMAELPPVHASVMTALISNLATVSAFAKALAGSCEGSAACQRLLQHLHDQQHPYTAERTANLLANMACSVALRHQLASRESAKALADTALRMLESPQQESGKAAQAVLSCMFNLATDACFRDALPGTCWCKILQAALQQQAATASPSSLTTSAVALAARASSSRQAAEQLLCHSALTEHIVSTGIHIQKVLAASVDQAEDASLRTLAHVMQCLAAWGAIQQLAHLQSVECLQMLAWACSAPTVSNGCAGNAALCLAHVAARCVHLCCHAAL